MIDLTLGRWVPLLVVLAVVLASCAGEEQPDPGQVDATSNVATPDDAAGQDAAGASAAPGAASEPMRPRGEATPRPHTSDATGDAAGDSASTPTNAAPTHSSDTPVPATPAGTYEYEVDVAGSVGGFPPQESTYTLTSVVDPVDANGHQRTTSTPMNDDGETGQTSEQTIAHGHAELRLVHMTSRGPGGGDSEFRPDPPVMLVATDAASGDSWSWSMTSTDGDIEVDATIEVTGAETVTVGREDVRTLVIRTVIEFRGEGFAGIEESTTWFAPDRRLTVREESTMTGSGSFNGQEFTFESEETRILRSLTPTAVPT